MHGIGNRAPTTHPGSCILLNPSIACLETIPPFHHPVFPFRRLPSPESGWRSVKFTCSTATSMSARRSTILLALGLALVGRHVPALAQTYSITGGSGAGCHGIL